MHIPVVEKFHSPLSPWEVFQRLYPNSRHSVFLDSQTYAPPNQTFSYLAANPFLELTLEQGRIRLSGEEERLYPARELFKVVRRLFKKYRQSGHLKFPFLTGGAIGFWSYELVAYFEKIRLKIKKGSRLPELSLGFYRDLIVYDHQNKVYWLVTNLFSKRVLNQTQVQERTRGTLVRLRGVFETSALESAPGQTSRREPGFRLRKFRPEMVRSNFERMVKRVQNYIRRGDIYQANLSQRFTFSFEGSPLTLYDRLRRINPSPFASFLKVGDIHIVSSSPERLIRKRGRICETQPIAGTRPRQRAEQGEASLTRELLANEKERAEHVMLVDLERNDLGRVCHWPSVRVKEMMHVEKYSHVIHLVSRVVGRMRKNQDGFDLIRAMFPGGTITGCPKIRCMQIIDELEPVRRGVYTGSIGYIDFQGDLDLNIVIRTLVLEKNVGFLQVGAGIVYDSDPAREYEETLYKGEALTEALVQASL